MIRSRFSVLIVFLTFILFSCSKENEQSFLPYADFTILTPTAGATYHFGDTIYVTGTIKGTQGLHGYEVSLKKEGTTDNLFFEHHHEHANPLQVMEKWKNNLTQPTQMVLEVSAILDDKAHKKTQTVSFQIAN